MSEMATIIQTAADCIGDTVLDGDIDVDRFLREQAESVVMGIYPLIARKVKRELLKELRRNLLDQLAALDQDDAS